MSLEILSLLLPVLIATIVVADVVTFRKYEYIVIEDRSKKALLLGLKASLITAAVALILSVLLMVIQEHSMILVVLFFLSAFLILGILSLPWIVYGLYLLIKPIIKK